MTIEKKLLGTTPVSGAVDPEAVSFDGSNDYLSRSSDLTGNADSKTFTVSAWVYRNAAATQFIYQASTDRFNFDMTPNGLEFYAFNSSGVVVLDAHVTLGRTVPINTWMHLLVSIDLANTSNRYWYINDINVTSSAGWNTYTNSSIDFTRTAHAVGSSTTGSGKMEGRLAHVFLDYTYRNLSTVSNRRLFIDADGKPASGQASLNPILYLPLKDAATAGSNSGTGGDFTVNGVLDTASRAPNQNNCSASVFDGVNDYLARSSGSMTSLVDSKQITLSFNALFTETGRFFVINSPPANVFEFELATNGVLEVGGNSGTGVNNYHSRFPVGIKFNVNYNFQLSIDLENATQVLYVDGVNKTSTASSVILNNNSFGFNSSSLALAENISGPYTPT